MGDPPISVFVFEPPGGEVRKVAEGGHILEMGWSADGLAIVIGVLIYETITLEVRTVTLATGEVIVAELDVPGAHSYAPTPDGSRVAIGTSAGIVVANADLGDSTVIVPYEAPENWMPQRPRWSPDGQWILFNMVATQGDAIVPWIVRPDGTDAQAVVEAPGYGASWQPLLVPLP